ncbi:hypothetical protein GWI33_004208 [Rhynchophorus ferrugineus]|uniref:Uncharacterized protein n=1 Tax=Rhynchophorus ferrugineus TaxID=354439 RepID=A0A834IX99_RHYFE|nr:hypothetical protein GWI33_004208 [Rhynchophorus ferrugineus]
MEKLRQIIVVAAAISLPVIPPAYSDEPLSFNSDNHQTINRLTVELPVLKRFKYRLRFVRVRPLTINKPDNCPVELGGPSENEEENGRRKKPGAKTVRRNGRPASPVKKFAGYHTPRRVASPTYTCTLPSSSSPTGPTPPPFSPPASTLTDTFTPQEPS